MHCHQGRKKITLYWIFCCNVVTKWKFSVKIQWKSKNNNNNNDDDDNDDDDENNNNNNKSNNNNNNDNNNNNNKSHNNNNDNNIKSNNNNNKSNNNNDNNNDDPIQSDKSDPPTKISTEIDRNMKKSTKDGKLHRNPISWQQSTAATEIWSADKIFGKNPSQGSMGNRATDKQTSVLKSQTSIQRIWAASLRLGSKIV